MSHEIRTPMNGIIGMADLLAESSLSPNQKVCLETIRSSGEALLLIINDVLDYSKIEADKLALSPAPFDLETCIHDVAMLLQPAAVAKGLELVVDYDIFLPSGFVGDAGRLRQVLTNLLGNAIKFTQTGHIALRVLGFDDGDGAFDLNFSVEDTGIGIDEDRLDDVFREFQQVESDHNRTHDGTGLGLSISRRLVQLMGGDMWVDSQANEGSVFAFQINLPLAPDQSEDTAPAAHSGRAFVVESSGQSRRVLLKQLDGLGLSTLALQDAGALSSHAPGQGDLVFLNAADPAAPNIAERLRAKGSAAHVLALVDAPGGVDERFDASLQRPVMRKTLIETLNALNQTNAAQSPPANAPPVHAATANALGRPMRVLVAEDNRTNRLVIEKMLQTLAIDLAFAENGLELVDHFQWQRPDLIFTDVSMPKMDGIEAVARIRALEHEAEAPPCPIVAITAHAMAGDAEKFLAAGMDAYLTKPLKKADLVSHICQAQPGDCQSPMPPQAAAS